MAIAIRKPDEIAKLKRAGEIVGKTLQYLQNTIKPGMSLKEIDALGEAYIREHGAVPSFKGLYGFTGSVCTSVNEVCIHGVPTDRVVEEGDILGLDIGTKLDGYFGDAAITMAVGKISAEDEALIECSKGALYHAIDSIREGMRFKELSKILEDYIVSAGYVPLRDYCGHGIGTKAHDEPNIPNYLEGKTNQGPKIKNGMVFCLEPMVCQKSGTPVVLEDKWSVISEDQLRSAHYEHTVAVVDGKAIILTEAQAS
ncbi:type I methionyl aminopeptidase [Sulfurovum sp. XGS-02]|uniref:type I methionyl aminopeptidase n=1 Tax=Sulfurovum sp. XGS-02 TaxID=2925411 RepID=UPI00202B4C95|nr:type I methionyl aminopeptidase [Sulfurovum sp. XGS-02]UPT77435.1 type I methionyl aminopeptidase [Sulfurovum sp. XGS-02]